MLLKLQKACFPFISIAFFQQQNTLTLTMAAQKSLNELLKWSILNQATANEDASVKSDTIKPMEKMASSHSNRKKKKKERAELQALLTQRVVVEPNCT